MAADESETTFPGLPDEIIHEIAGKLPYPSLRNLRLTGRRALIIEPKIRAEAMKNAPQYLKYFSVFDVKLVFIDREEKVWYYNLNSKSIFRLDVFPEPIKQVWNSISMIYAHGESGIIYTYDTMTKDLKKYDDIILLFEPNAATDEPYFVTAENPNTIRNAKNDSMLTVTGDNMRILQFSGTRYTKILTLREEFIFSVYNMVRDPKLVIGSTDGITNASVMKNRAYSFLKGKFTSPVIMVAQYQNFAFVLTLEGLYLLRATFAGDGRHFSSTKLFLDLRFISVYYGHPYISLVTIEGYIYVLKPTDFSSPYAIIKQQVIAAKTSGDTLIALDEKGTLYYKKLSQDSPMIPLEIGKTRD